MRPPMSNQGGTGRARPGANGQVSNAREDRTHPTLLTPGEVAEIFGVHAKTVTRWAKQGRLTAIRTPGGHRRYDAGEVTRLYGQGPVSEDDAIG